jgi:hypothetical protein
MFPKVSDNLAIQTKYEDMRNNGESHAIAEMCAFQAAPGVDTDAIFMMGRPTGRDCFGDSEIEEVAFQNALKKAKKAGVSIQGKTYSTAIAQERGDPGAWISGKGDMKRRCIETGSSCEGDVKVAPPLYKKEE